MWSFFCEEHRGGTLWEDDDETEIASNLCEKCSKYEQPFKPKPDVQELVNWKLSDDSWQQWRDENPEEVEKLKFEIIDE